MVSRNAMMSAGTARRSAGSAVSNRRYAGFAIACASPLMDAESCDAPAVSARAMVASVRVIPYIREFGWMCRIFPESLSLESKVAPLSRVLGVNSPQLIPTGIFG
jgi:hypothetical protein